MLGSLFFNQISLIHSVKFSSICLSARNYTWYNIIYQIWEESQKSRNGKSISLNLFEGNKPRHGIGLKLLRNQSYLSLN